MRVNDVFSDWLASGGIFSALSGLDVPWSDDITGINLDMIYHGTFSGNKNISNLVKEMLKADNTATLTSARKTQLATIIYQMNADKWGKLWATLNFEYNPISNYDMSESETKSGVDGGTKTNTGTQTDTHTGTQTKTNTGTQTTTHTGTVGTSETNSVTGHGTTDTGLYGFNSADAVGDGESETSTTNSGTGSSTRTDDLSDGRTDNLTEGRTDNLTDTRTDNLMETDSRSYSETRTLTRSGNIGTMTSQQMVESEREIDKFNVFYAEIFSDIDKVLTIATY